MNMRICLVVHLLVVVFGRQINHSKGEDKSVGKNGKGAGNQSSNNGGNPDVVDEDLPEKWVVDSIYYDDYQSDSPITEGNFDFCPPVPNVISEGACASDACQSDSDCSDSYRCCFNGCAFACLLEVQPAAVVDWKKEPRRSRSGISWLVNGPSILSNDAELCSTTPVGPDEDPLLCPHGYFCHVDTPKKAGKMKPNRGYCVKQTDETYSPGEEELVLKSPLRGSKICNMDGVMLLEDASIRLKDKTCRCKGGLLSCKERKSKARVKVRRKPKTSASKKSRRRSRRRNRQRTKVSDKNRT